VSWYVEPDLPLAEQYARKAIALEPNLAEGHASLGIAALYQRRFAEGEKELKRALELNPNYAMAHHWYGLYLLTMGRLNEALAENDRARQLDPFSLPINHLRGVMLLGLHEYDQAVEQLQFAAAIDPQSPAPHQDRLRIHWIEGKVPEALAEERQVAALTHDAALLRDEQEVGAAYAHGGLRAAELKAAQLKEQGYRRTRRGNAAPAHSSYSAFAVALQFGLLEDREKTLQWLDQAAQDHHHSFTEDLTTAPELDFLRSDPRFQDLVHRLGLP
jgi:tetratricopeptide (TPR) repeat protein